MAKALTTNHYLAAAAILAVFLLHSPAISSAAAAAAARSTYIIHTNPSHKPSSSPTHRHWYSTLLRRLSGDTDLLYTYTIAAVGFSAILTPSQASALRSFPSIISVVPDRRRSLHTTHTPDFLRLSQSSGIWPSSDLAADTVIGILDTGIYPFNRSSFSGDDDDLGPPPGSFSGACESGPGFPKGTCNRKLVGARFFPRGYEAAHGRIIDGSMESRSPLDTEGHGTHTASTAAGAAAPGAGLFGYARGVARGVAPRARIAAYKICWKTGCYDSDILAAMDAAVADGVDVISLSVGASSPSRYYRDPIAIGAFWAAQRGVVVSCSAGNSGPGPYTAVNIAPWILTVGASTVDREFPADVVLGDGKVYGGVSLYSGEPPPTTQLPIVSSLDCGSRYCIPGELDAGEVAGKIVLCDRGSNARVEKGSAVKLAGGKGMILANTEENGEELLADAHLVAATMVGRKAGDEIRRYISSSSSPTAAIALRGTVIGGGMAAPRVAAFSSRGPNYRTPEILKPDVIAPGVNILAGWTGRSSPTGLDDVDTRRVEFNIISGTSMSCPHVSGAAALLRQARPRWSTAAIKSALMTTAYNTDNAGGVIGDLAADAAEVSTPFARGAGHVDPNRALDPGLVYDIAAGDYLYFLCSIGYSPELIAVFTEDAVNCSNSPLRGPGDLNYPSFSVVFDGGAAAVKHTRVVRNVGDAADAVYDVEVSSPPGVEITVSPRKLVFSKVEQSLAYEITFSPAIAGAAGGTRSFGWISWSDGNHVVRSPVAAGWVSSAAALSSSI